MARGLRRAAGFFDGGGVTPSPTPSLQLYKRTYGAVDYLVDVDGKLVTDDTVYVEVGASGNPNACVLSLCSENEELSDIIATWGKTPAVFSSQELGTTDYTITIGNDFVNIVEETATLSIEAFFTEIVDITPELPGEMYQPIQVELNTPVSDTEIVSNLHTTIQEDGSTIDGVTYKYDGRIYINKQGASTDSTGAIVVTKNGNVLNINDNSSGHSNLLITGITWGE